MARVGIIGAGIGGLSSAICLAADGHEVQIFEALPRAGGKAGIAEHDGVEFDTGPSVVTLPEIFRDIFVRAGMAFEDEVKLRQPEPAFRYDFPDGPTLELHHEVEATLDSVRATLGASAAAELQRFFSYAADIWEVGAPNFVYGGAPTVSTMLRLGVTRLNELRKIDSLRTMWSAIENRVRNRYLRVVLARYATYNGSSPYRAPATLNCIAHVELALGGFGVEGGIYELVRALVRAAESLGVQIDCGVRVERIAYQGRTPVALETAGGRHALDALVVNADVAHLASDLLPDRLSRSVVPSGEPSMSGYNAVVAARAPAHRARASHTVLFSSDYRAEFDDIFERQQPPRDPTIYLCAQRTTHGRQGWTDREPVFVMANAPAVGPGAGGDYDALERRVIARLEAHGLLQRGESEIVWRRCPRDLAALFPGSRGSIYGAASNGALAAFRRPPNRAPGLERTYLASGSAHPGGGLPLCALSGVAAARALREDLGPGHTVRRPA